MSKSILIEALPRVEQIDILIRQFSGHGREAEIADILSTLTSCKIKGGDYTRYYEGLTIEELKERIKDGLLNINEEDVLQEEQNAWTSTLNALGYATILEIMEKWAKCADKYIAILKNGFIKTLLLNMGDEE